VENPVRATGDQSPEGEPVFLALPVCRPDTDDGQAGSELLRLIEADYAPAVERDQIAERLRRTAGFAEELADPIELRHHPGPLAALNDYKHRLQSIRCEYVTARLRADDMEARFHEAQSALKRLQERLSETQNQLVHYRGALEEIRSSRAWRVLERCGGLRWLAVRLAGVASSLRRLLRRRPAG
jgi:hypothetical protein